MDEDVDSPQNLSEIPIFLHQSQNTVAAALVHSQDVPMIKRYHIQKIQQGEHSAAVAAEDLSIGLQIVENDTSKAVSTSTGRGSHPHPTAHHYNEEEWKSRIFGFASTKIFTIHQDKEESQEKMVLTTHALVEEPMVLAVNVLKLDSHGNIQVKSSITQQDAELHVDEGHMKMYTTMQLDLSSILLPSDVEMYSSKDARTQNQRQPRKNRSPSETRGKVIVKTICFQDLSVPVLPLDHSNHIRWSMLLVDHLGNIIRVRFVFNYKKMELHPYLDSNRPDSTVRYWPIQSFLVGTTRRMDYYSQYHHQQVTEGYTLVSSQVDFLDSHRILLAISPFILCVNIQSGKVAQWSEQHCVYGGTFSTSASATWNSLSTSTTADTPGHSDANDYHMMHNRRARKQTLTSVLKNATGLLMGKSTADMFIEEQEERWKRKRNKLILMSNVNVWDQNQMDVEENEYNHVGHGFPMSVNHMEDLDGGDDDEEDDNYVMAATSAFAVLWKDAPNDIVIHSYKTDNKNNDSLESQHPVAKAVFTLHADGTIRQWILPDTTVVNESVAGMTYPLRMIVLYDSNARISESEHFSALPMPPPHTWSSSADSVSLSCALYRSSSVIERHGTQTNLLGSLLKTPLKKSWIHGDDDNLEYSFVLCVYIRTVDSLSWRNTSTLDSTSWQDEKFKYIGPCHLTVLHGSCNSSTTFDSVQTKIDRLQSPDEASHIISMSFDVSKSRDMWSLHVIYSVIDATIHSAFRISSTSLTRFTPSTSNLPHITQLVSYNSSNLYPTRVSNTSTLDDMADAAFEEFILQSTVLKDKNMFPFCIPRNTDMVTDDDSDENSKEQQIKCVERWYMNRLFRSSWGRASGTFSPSEGSIRRALLQVCPMIGTDSSILHHQKIGSLEFDTLRAMREWSKVRESQCIQVGKEKSKRYEASISHNLSAEPLSSGSYSSVYDVFASKDYQGDVEESSSSWKDADEEVALKATNAPEDYLGLRSDEIGMVEDEENTNLIKLHKIWMKLLHAVWKEEAKLRMPITYVALHSRNNIRSGLLLRSGITSFIRTSPLLIPSHTSSSIPDNLDRLCLNLVKALRSGCSETRLMLAKFEMDVSYVTANGSLVLKTAAAVVDELQSELAILGLKSDGRLISALRELVNNASIEDIRIWLSSIPSQLGLTSSSIGYLPSMDINYNENETKFKVENALLISCASILSTQRIEYIRSVVFARSLGVATLNIVSEHWFYLNKLSMRILTSTAALRWVNSQATALLLTSDKLSAGKIPPLHAFIPSLSDKVARSANVASLLSESSTVSSKRSDAGSTTRKCAVLDMALVQFCGRYAESLSSIDEFIDRLSSAFICALQIPACFGVNFSNALPNYLQDRSRYLLRLVAPFIPYPELNFDSTTVYTQKIVAAECLLSEIGFAARHECLRLRSSDLCYLRASTLLLHDATAVDYVDLSVTLDILSNPPTLHSSYRNSILSEEKSTEKLVYFLSSLVDADVSDSVGIVSKMQTTRTLFIPWLHASIVARTDPLDFILNSFPALETQALSNIKHLVRTLCILATLIQRIEVLQRYSVSSSSLVMNNTIKDVSTKTVLSAIQDAIKMVQKCFPKRFYEVQMIEYPLLWTNAFQNASLGRFWAVAFEAALSNPKKERNVIEFKKLVITMADVGAFSSLLAMISAPVVSTTHECNLVSDSYGSKVNCNYCHLNLYELAADTLIEAAYESSCCDADILDCAIIGKANYKGCLYALHASQKNWKRCAQAMDYSLILSVKQMLQTNNATDDMEVNSLEDMESEQKCIDFATLSALASYHSIEMVTNPNHRFIVQGELGPYPTPPFSRSKDDFTHASTTNLLAVNQDTDKTLVELLLIGDVNKGCNRRLQHLRSEHYLSNRSSKMMAARSLFMDSSSSFSVSEIFLMLDKPLMASLAQLGYYSHYLALANDRREDPKGNKCRPGGVDLFSDAFSFMLLHHLAPISVQSSLMTSKSEQFKGNTLRPSMFQLYQACPRKFFISSLWRNQELNEKASRAATAMELVRVYTERYSAFDNSVASELAHTLLELDTGRSALPMWLTSLLVGPPSDHGLFSNSGNPSDLILIYMRWGMHVEACRVITTKLLGNGTDRRKGACNRLPEKGNIDYVPYNLIDVLWEMIDKVLHDPDVDKFSKSSLSRARCEMEWALKEHFELMKISEAALLSARVLSGN